MKHEPSMRIEPNPDCRDCFGDGWVETGEGWGAENVRCRCTDPVKAERSANAQTRKRGHEAFSHFASIAQIIDDCLAAGIAVHYVKMPVQERETLIRQRAKKRKRPTIPGQEATVLGVPVVADDGIGRSFIVVTNENDRRLT